jgi:tRNA threonylcarbamoyladenosine biosynthesis protein TsaB
MLLIETSGRVGRVGLADERTLLAERVLDETRRHARDLTPAIADLLRELAWRPRDIAVVVVSLGPGSYTGLRVGVVTAKTLAYATGCAAVGVPTFHVLARQAEAATTNLAVISDAQQGKLYMQPFRRADLIEPFAPAGEVAIVPGREWATSLTPAVSASGPGLRIVEAWLPPGTPTVPAALREPTLAGLLAVGWEKYSSGARDDPMRLEPLYLRRSSAEEQWDRRPGAEPTNGSAPSS